MTKLLQCLRDELVRRDYAASTIRSYIQIVDTFREHTGARLDRLTPAQLQQYEQHCYFGLAPVWWRGEDFHSRYLI